MVPSLSVDKLRETVQEESKKNPTAKTDFAAGYGGKFGVQTDRKDKSAVGFDAGAMLVFHATPQNRLIL